MRIKYLNLQFDSKIRGGLIVMDLEKFIEELLILKAKGYGKNKVVMYENLFGEKPYHTTIENIRIQKATFDKEKDVIVMIR